MPVAELVLVAPMIPKPGETAGQWWTATGHERAIAPLIQRIGPMRAWGQEQMAEVFLHDVPADIADAAQDFVGEPGPGMFGEPWPLPAWPAVPTRVLAPRDDHLFPSLFSAASPGSGSTLVVEELPGGHVPMLARSRELAARLAGAVT